MYKRLLEAIKKHFAEREIERKKQYFLSQARQKSAIQHMYNSIRDKAIIYCCKLDSVNNSRVVLPPAHRVDCALHEIISTKKDVIKYHKRFPYRELAMRLG